MLQNKLKESPEKAISLGLTLITVGLMIIVIGISWPRFPFLANLWPSHNDFLRGFLFGFAIVTEIAGVVLNVKAAVEKRHPL